MTNSTCPPGRILLTTYGSYGDLHPYIAIGRALVARGHRVTLATASGYQDKVRAQGLDFQPVRPEMPDPKDLPQLAERVIDLHRGPEVVFRELIMPHVRDSFADLCRAAEGADLLVSHPLMVTVPCVAEKKGLPWASSVLAPVSFLSAHDPPVLPNALGLARLRFLGAWLHGPLFAFFKWAVRHWADPLHQLRAELGLPPVRKPTFEGQHSPYLVLALYSPLLGRPQPDWPANVVVTGYPFFDDDGQAGLPEELERFLDQGPPPLVFTLGTSAVLKPGPFFRDSIEAARRLGKRAVLLVGLQPADNLPATLPEGVIAVPYARHSLLFPRAAAVVHQGGIGTTGQGMRSGRPTLVVPFGFDQPDNADRVQRLGIARVLLSIRYSAARAIRELRPLLEQPRYARRAAEVGEAVRHEDGAARACDALEELLRRWRLRRA
jgi:UDP:flavonoid glycosyltransferase YjiC (YdhE family)